MRQLYVIVDLPHAASERELADAACNLACAVHGKVNEAYLLCDLERPSRWERLLKAISGNPIYQLRNLLAPRNGVRG